MIHHVLFPANDPRHVADVLAEFGIAPPSWTVEWLGRLWSHGKFFGGL